MMSKANYWSLCVTQVAALFLAVIGVASAQIITQAPASAMQAAANESQELKCFAGVCCTKASDGRYDCFDIMPGQKSVPNEIVIPPGSGCSGGSSGCSGGSNLRAWEAAGTDSSNPLKLNKKQWSIDQKTFQHLQEQAREATP